MSSHILIQNGQAHDAARFTTPETLEALDSNATLDVLHIANDTDLDALAPALDRVESILIDFPAYTDGRGFSLAKQLRTKHGYAGLLVADGGLIPDQYALALQSGFDAVRIETDLLARHTIEDWANALNDFNLTYQRGYTVEAGPSTCVFDLRKTAAAA